MEGKPTGTLENQEFLSVNDAALLLGVGRNTLYEAIARGEIPALHIGRRVVINKQALFAASTVRIDTQQA
jgi:excisionase family DNA binding protein